jgi:hypothetical protein
VSQCGRLNANSSARLLLGLTAQDSDDSRIMLATLDVRGNSLQAKILMVPIPLSSYTTVASTENKFFHFGTRWAP